MASESEVRGWVVGRVPQEWYEGTLDVQVDAEEILVIGRLADVAQPDGVDLAAAREGRMRQHREGTRDQRMRISREAMERFGRPISWGVRIGDGGFIFTHLAVPVTARLRMGERKVLDALIAAGVARNRSQALAWCARLVAQHQAEWLNDLSEAAEKMTHLREQGPRLN